MTDLEKNAQTVEELLDRIGTEINVDQAVSKIDWMKILELIMQILPLILAFFKPVNGQPEA